MARHLFPGDLHLLPDGNPAANTAFTWWTEPESGTQLTDVLASDGVSTIPFTTDSDGLRPYMYGPDGLEVMFIDTGADIRFPVYAVDVVTDVLDDSPTYAATLASLQTQISALQNGTVTGVITAASITDSTSIGRAVITAASSANARAAIGAGTSSLVVGTTSTTAKAGDYAPTVTQVTGLSAELSARELIIRWDDGVRAWPARPATYPFGALFLSTNDPTAPAPPATGLLVGDVWRRHPNAS